MGGAVLRNDLRPPPKCRLAVIKIASRCNLNCSYCYMYHMGDESYREQPKFMTDKVLDALVERCVEHCAAHDIPRFTIALHGGEPLLAGTRRFERLIANSQRRFGNVGIEPRFVVQTNGVLLDDAWCKSLKATGVRVGISIDGPQATHDQKRVDHRGKGSYNDVVAGFRRAQDYGLRPGLLAVIDPWSDAQEAYEHLKRLSPDKVDFLLPEGNHVIPPAGLGLGAIGTPYARWLLEVFELWWSESAPFRVRIFEQIMGATLGVPFKSDALGGQENEILVIETNGDIGPVDVLRAAIPGSSCTGVNVLANSLDEGLRQQTVALYHASHLNICVKCQRCPVNEICGGGYLSHRFAQENGFENPSVYCGDLTALIVQLREHAISILPPEARKQSEMRSLTLAQVVALQAGD
jgi:uncharacterized protein